MRLVLLWQLYLGHTMYFTNEGVPEKNSRVNSVNCSLSDCLFRLPCTYTYNYVKQKII